MLEELVVALDAISEDESVKVVVLTGAGKAFSAGVDLKALGGRTLEGGAVGDYLDVPARKVIDRLTTIPKIVIARVNGFCFTGALEMVLACDLVIVANEARLGDTHTKWGDATDDAGNEPASASNRGDRPRERELSYTAKAKPSPASRPPNGDWRRKPCRWKNWTVRSTTLLNSCSQIAWDHSSPTKICTDGASTRVQSDGLEYEASARYVIADTAERIAGFR